LALSDLDSKIDELYQRPLGEFVAARTALAKSLAKADADRVKRLAKPTVVPWAVNQVYWRDRRTYDTLIETGEKLRKAQVAALEGRNADLRGAGDAHRRAMAEAVKAAERLAAGAGSKPGADALMRTFEALSLGSAPVEHGRLAAPLQPAGFEALGGVKIKGPVAPPPPSKQALAEKRKAAEAARRTAEAEKKHEAEIKKAESALESARRRFAEAQARLRATRNREP
jgi:hypothetical protein